MVGENGPWNKSMQIWTVFYGKLAVLTQYPIVTDTLYHVYWVMHSIMPVTVENEKQQQLLQYIRTQNPV